MAGQGHFQDIDYMISNYRLWVREIIRLESILYGGRTNMSSWGVAQYGDQAAMPKGSSIRSAVELEQMDARERIQYNRLCKIQSYVFALEFACNVFKTEELCTIYDCFLDGMTYREIAEHMGSSISNIHRKRREIVKQMEQNEQIGMILQFNKVSA
ncbi:MAG: sigma-70 family RNA polymerase sigma factor [Solibacillus sp.]